MVKDVDLVFDAVGTETIKRSWQVIKAGGSLVSIASYKVQPPRLDLHGFIFIVKTDKEQLEKIAGLVEAGQAETLEGRRT